MKNSKLLTPVVALLTAFTSLAADEDPMLIQAESSADDLGAEVLSDGDALQGSYAMNSRDYNPVFKMETPSGAESYTIWIRARGTGLQLKAAPEAGGSQKELKWIWKPGKTWTWKSFGTFPAADLGAQIVIIRGKEPADDAGLDAVIISSDPGFDPTVDGAVEGLSDE
jgi:hypothetical protein